MEYKNVKMSNYKDHKANRGIIGVFSLNDHQNTYLEPCEWLLYIDSSQN